MSGSGCDAPQTRQTSRAAAREYAKAIAHSAQRTTAPHSSHASDDVRRLTTRKTRRFAARVSRMARESGGVSGSRLRMPRVSAMLTAGHGPGSRDGMSMSPDSARHHASALGVAAVSRSARGSRAARSSATSRECIRGGPGGLWAASCSSISTSVAGDGSGASSAERVPAARRAEPSRRARHATRRSSSGTPESSLTARSSFASR